jgi:hypothetical protein
MSSAPEFVTQHTVEAVLGVRARLYMRLAREHAFRSAKVARDIVARTSDVASYLELRLAGRAAPDVASETTALARAGLRRVSQ